MNENQNYTENKVSPEYKEQLRQRSESLLEFITSGAIGELDEQIQEEKASQREVHECGATKQVVVIDRRIVLVDPTALANFIMAEIPGEPSRSEGATDCAIRIMREQKAEVARLREKLDSVAIMAGHPGAYDRQSIADYARKALKGGGA